MNNNATGSYNTAVGSQAMYSTSATATRLTGTYNTAAVISIPLRHPNHRQRKHRPWALGRRLNTTFTTHRWVYRPFTATQRDRGMYTGVSPLYSNTTGNMKCGFPACRAYLPNTTGNYNVAVGIWPSIGTPPLSGNVAIGTEALYSQTTPGAANMAFGYRAGTPPQPAGAIRLWDIKRC